MGIFVHISVFCSLLVLVSANYVGPYLFWGLPKLESLENSALNGLDEELLKNVYSEASAVIIFVKNASHEMSQTHYPSLENLLEDRKWAYMPQSVLIYDPMDLNQHTELILLSGTSEQEDIELCALFRDAEINYGQNKVLGILANAIPPPLALNRRRREAEEGSTTTSSTTESSIQPTEDPIIEDHIYHLADKALMYTSEAPVLNFLDSGTTLVLKRHGSLFVDDRETYVRLIINFFLGEGSKQKLTLRFRFELASGYWSLPSVEVEHDSKTTLNVVGTLPSAPLMPAYSWKCSRSLVFRNENVTLTLQSVQVQPKLNGAKSFAPAIDCVGFMTTPIWSGLFVSFILLVVLAISLTAILDIKTPSRFENSRSKQLTFTVQE